MDANDLESLAAAIRTAETVVALTGAGISAPSGVPTFRGEDGVWDDFDEADFTIGRFRRDPAGFWRDRLELQRALYGREYEPNAAHEALAGMGRDGHLAAIVTQNTDGLHARAADELRARETDGPEADEAESGHVAIDETGAGDVAIDETGAGNVAVDETDSSDDFELIELHGNARRVVCADCGRRGPAEPAFERATDGEVPPRCDCGGVLRPDVVLFGQQLPRGRLERARTLARESDVFLAVGSSLVVEPAASLPRLAARSGGTVAVVNLEATPADDAADRVFREDVTDVLPRLRATVG